MSEAALPPPPTWFQRVEQRCALLMERLGPELVEYYRQPYRGPQASRFVPELGITATALLQAIRKFANSFPEQQMFVDELSEIVEELKQQIKQQTNADAALANRIAARMVINAVKCSSRNIYFSVLNLREPSPFPIMWRHKNASGVVFCRGDVLSARDWVKTALLAGYSVARNQRKKAGGGSHDMTRGDHWENAGLSDEKLEGELRTLQVRLFIARLKRPRAEET